MKTWLSRETPQVLTAMETVINELLQGPEAEVPVESEQDLRRLVGVGDRPRVVLVREMERAEGVRSSSSGRAFQPPPKLGTLARLVRLEVNAALKKIDWEG